MTSLVIYNWAPWDTYVQVNGIADTSWSPLKGSQLKYGYFPYSKPVPRDLSLDFGTAETWGKCNDLTIKWAEVDDPMFFSRIADPGGLTNVDLLLWVFPNRVVFSQQSSQLAEVYPT